VAVVFKISRRTPYTVLGQYSFTHEYDTSYNVKGVAQGSALEGYLDGGVEAGSGHLLPQRRR